jgi:hypothetical protein
VRRSLVLVIALAACGSASKPAAAPPAATGNPPPAPAAAPKDGVPVVIDAGAEPRYALRYHPSAGAQQVMSLELEMGMTIDGQAIVIPPMTMEAIQQITDVADDGTMSMRVMFTRASLEPSPELTPDQHAAMQAMMRRYENVGMTSRMTAHGELLDVAVDPGTPEDIKKTFEQMQTQFQALPKEPIGVGARWTTHLVKPLDTVPGALEVDATCRVLEVDAEHIRLVVELTMASDGTPGSPTVTGTARGESVVDLRTFRGEGGIEMWIESSADGHVFEMDSEMTFVAR